MDSGNLNESGNARRCSKERSKRKYSKKRNRRGSNQYTKKKAEKTLIDDNDNQSGEIAFSVVVDDVVSDDKIDSVPETRTTASSKKIKPVKEVEDDHFIGFRLFDVSILKELIDQVLCPTCRNKSLEIGENVDRRKGLASFFVVECSNCEFSYSNYTSKGVTGSQQLMEVNMRSVYAMRRIGVGHKGLEKFCGTMNMPPPAASKNYDKLMLKLGIASEKVAKTSMIDAAYEVKCTVGEEIGVSYDGSWQRRGYSSLNGVGTIISVDTGKILDTTILSRYCKTCAVNENMKTEKPDEYENWWVKHEENCQLNHTGSSSSMETAGAVQIFSRSLSKYGLKYLKFYGDGDSSSFNAVQNIYADSVVKKFECLGHYQKRVGNRLRNLRKKNKGLGGKAKDKEIIHQVDGGKIIKEKKKARGKLTDSAIDKLQNYFGIALRSGATTVPELRKRLLASFFHAASSAGNEYHDYCPQSSDSWCQYQRDLINKTNLYKPGKGFEPEVIKDCRMVYVKLTSDAELSKCLHGQTQNANESFHSMIWQRAPKHKFCNLNKLKTCVFDAISYFNYGGQSIIDTLKLLSIDAGHHTRKMVVMENTRRKLNACYKTSEESKKRRKIIRGLKKKKTDNLKTKEGVTYESGAF